jgi:hypothetical protein
MLCRQYIIAAVETVFLKQITNQQTISIFYIVHMANCRQSNHTIRSPQKYYLLFSDILYYDISKPVQHISMPRGIPGGTETCWIGLLMS